MGELLVVWSIEFVGFGIDFAVVVHVLTDS